MQDQTDLSTIDLSGLRRGQWISQIASIGDAEGFSEPLGRRHHGIFVERGHTLLVSFESLPGIEALSDNATPLGWELAQTEGWSSLALISARDTWFRDQRVFEFFDQLLDDGFFDEFEQVIFYGAGPCGYAAAAYSVTSPGARVLMLQPQATLDPRVTEWDERFAESRRVDFTSRFGYAPDMLDACEKAFVLYDPRERLDAMHSALFERKGVTRYRLPFMGGALQADLIELGLLVPLLKAVADDSLTTLSFARMMRARRDHLPYLRKLLAKVEKSGRTAMAERLCENVLNRLEAPRFRRRLEAIRAVG
ncbi:phosphoadenosine phosphosulfate reductase [Citreicella sp. C3M06]|uniref:phosphoadenosine phosphosulfate reductase n=1 Tax=Citreicella sp. C3M06 TaxID=2841564 RepID=UPI001C0A35AF|nr:phosphoadenosine phosphosulfate reductase [Citreicella sp. C3M06]MBU2963385.1 phosphoadenosine phosphosulfate reductase [Citreicella sp. C3M06]